MTFDKPSIDFQHFTGQQKFAIMNLNYQVFDAGGFTAMCSGWCDRFKKTSNPKNGVHTNLKMQNKLNHWTRICLSNDGIGTSWILQ